MFWLGVAVGFVTLPLLLTIYALGSEALSKSHGLECVADDLAFATGEKTRIQLWFIWKWHINTIGRKRWHKKAIAEYLKKWGR